MFPKFNNSWCDECVAEILGESVEFVFDEDVELRRIQLRLIKGWRFLCVGWICNWRVLYLLVIGDHNDLNTWLNHQQKIAVPHQKSWVQSVFQSHLVAELISSYFCCLHFSTRLFWWTISEWERWQKTNAKLTSIHANYILEELHEVHLMNLRKMYPLHSDGFFFSLLIMLDANAF